MHPLEKKSVSELAQYKFFIPSYQRGYRWTKQQVEDLLTDIDDFNPEKQEGTDEKTWYCLHPIIVKESDNENQKDGLWYEVIDGQQRLTTIFLIMHYINEMWVGKEKDKEFELEYETREGSRNFLNELKFQDNDEVQINETNIDFFYITKAYNTIHSWAKEQKKKGFDRNDFQSKFKSHSKVIFYEIPSDVKDRVEVFTRINRGKIPLTNAELIKALFLNRSNFPSKSDPEKMRLQQLEIASEWDRIEYSLQSEEFWYFINKEEAPFVNRIEFIFHLMEHIDGHGSNKDQYSTFRFFSDKFKKIESNTIIESNWKDIKKLYQTLDEWFIDRELYHKIGYLIATGTYIGYLIKIFRDKKKHEFKEYLNKEIAKKIFDKKGELDDSTGAKKKILLLHNIQTMLNNEDSSSRFPFDRYKIEKWDVEHIHAIASDMPEEKQHQLDWLKESKEYIDDENLKEEIEKFEKNYDKESFDEIGVKVLEYFDNREQRDDDIDDISNLALLDAGTNRSYKNAVFPVKRKTIIEKEKKGTFIPICTKNIFLKYYSPKVKHMTFWGNDDKEAYNDDIEKIVKPYNTHE